MKPRLAIEIGGTKLQVATGSADGTILRKSRCAVRAGEPAAETCAHIVQLARGLVGPDGVERVGIGFGGPVDSQAGRVVLSHHVEGWGGFALRDWAETAFGAACVLENDSNAAALAEAALGAGKGARVVFYTNVGSGIGGGLVIDGRLYNGRRGAAEIGHTKLWDASRNGYVIVEELCSGWAINRQARDLCSAGLLERVLHLAGGTVEHVTAEHVGRAAAEGDAPAKALLEQAAGHFAIALCNMIALLNPDAVVVGGGVSLMGEVFLGPLRKAVAENVFDIYAGNFRIVPAALGEDVVLAGALLI